MIFGLEPTATIPDDWTPLEAVAIVKCLNHHGELELLYTGTLTTTTWERIGMLTAALDTERQDMSASFTPTQDDEED